MSESLKELTRQLMETKQSIIDLNERKKELSSTQTDLELRIIQGMNAIGMDNVRNNVGTFTITDTIVPSDVDWQVLHEWIIQNDMLHLLQRRISTVEYRSLIDMGEDVPGVKPFTKVTLKTLKPK